LSNDPGFVKPPKGYEDWPLKWQKWGEWKAALGPSCAPHFLNDVSKRRRRNEGVIVAVYGPPGSGKTYFALTLCQILDPKFDVKKQIIFTREQFLDIVNNPNILEAGQCLIIDETQFSMLSREFSDPDQIIFMKHLSAIRHRNFIIFLIVLNITMLDKIARDFTLSHKIFMLDRGQGRVYRYQMGPLSKEPYPKTIDHKLTLPLPDSNYKTGCKNPYCLSCEHSGLTRTRWINRDKWMTQEFDPCMHQRAEYERMKRQFLEDRAQEAVDIYTPKPKATVESRHLALLECIDHIGITDKGHLNYDDMQLEIEKATNAKVSNQNLRSDRIWFENTHPEIIVFKKAEKKANKEKNKI
jgi:energy-coupling factor transporter ATP-binding protein EcfA2